MMMRKTMVELRDLRSHHLRNPFLLSISLSYDVMTALLFALLTWNLLHQQAGALLSHWTFPLGTKTVADGVFLSFGTGPAAYLGRDRDGLHMDGRWFYRTLVLLLHVTSHSRSLEN